MAPRFECTTGGHNKFWEIELDGDKTTTRYGKIGEDGRQSEKKHTDETKANKYKASQIKSKLKKGYVPANPEAEACAGGGFNTGEKKAKKARKAIDPEKLLDEMKVLLMQCGSNEGDGEASVFDIDLGGKQAEDYFLKTDSIEGVELQPYADRERDVWFKAADKIDIDDVIGSWNPEDEEEDDGDDEKVKAVINHMNSVAESSFRFARCQAGGSGCEFFTGIGAVVKGRAIGWAQGEVVWT